MQESWLVNEITHFLFPLFSLFSNISNSLVHFKFFGTFQGHDTCWISRILFHLIERQADVRFPRKSILFPCYVKELSIHVHCVCLAESINKWVERVAVRGGWRPLSGLICEIVNSVGQGNFTFVREKSGKSQGISNTNGCGNHEIASTYLQILYFV